MALRDYLASTQRDISRHGWGGMLMKDANQFQSAKARDTVVKRLDAILTADSPPPGRR